jgi:hypothetical protein
VLFVVGLGRLFSVAARMDRMRPRYMGMVRRFLVLPSLVVLCCFIVVAGSVSKMFVRLLVVFGSFFRHCSFLPGLRQRRRSLFSALGFDRQNSDGNVSAKLNKPSTSTAANAAMSVMGRQDYRAG